MSVLIVTSLGDIVVDLNTDRCPLTCKNFLKLCKIKYYNGCLFHTVQKDFTAQTGDPTGTGTGGDSIYKFLYGDQARFFGDEIYLDLKHSKTGTVAMASAGENLNASQFYFTLRDDLDYLDGKHTVFGEVAEGLETLTRINEAYVDEKGKPYKNIRIKHTYILDDPFDDPPQLTELIPDASPEGKPKDEIDNDVRLEDDWVPMDEQLGTAELEEVFREKEAHSSAVVLETIGDIPEAEIKPPDNVLFVCKLNPVTEDEDLHTIFSRFGTVVAADIIRDYKTGDSLCYAFIEFETNEACEQAYFKMDNALIDDRRIHVDFSQSVSKLWSQFRRKDNQGKGGRGCFKCGALDHIAKDCTGEASIKQPQYTLKDNNTQRGGDGNSRYEMVFDGDGPKSPREEKKRQDHEREDKSPGEEKRHGNHAPEDKTEKQNSNRRGSLDHERKDRAYRERDERNRESKTSRSGGSRRDEEYIEQRRDRDKYRSNRDYHGDRKEEGDYRKRSGDDREYYRKGNGGDRKGNGGDREGRDKRGEPRNRKRSLDDDDDEYRSEEHERRKRSAERERKHHSDRRR